MLIGRTTHHLAVQVDATSVAEFAVVFGLIWLAWFNGTLWHELHGREDGRSRNYIFLQMGLLALLGDGQRDSAVLLLVWLALFAVFLALGGDPDVTDFELGHEAGHRILLYENPRGPSLPQAVALDEVDDVRIAVYT